MVEDKYIGLLLAMSSSLAIGTSFIITKKVRLLSFRQIVADLTDVAAQGLNDAGRNNEYANASDNLAYLKNAIWWAGMSTSASMFFRAIYCCSFICSVVIGEGAQFGTTS